ncbi:DUF6677 family protein [Methanocaldococcus sp.]|uniref:DUF6677 family protein n=1 Tax=Methanocaldococcus sp. TaxID=2152917 RepID=UPI00261DBB4E|nr:DUF6677 family protein [Methanocaldococcus sp.]MCQ6253575.1 hypothetical protein [Methanocaldococcus sp.]
MNEMELMQIKEFVKDMDKQQKIVYYEQKKKNAGIAVLLSVIIPGAGQIYLGKVGKGIILFITTGTLIAFGLLLSLLVIGIPLLLLGVLLFGYIVFTTPISQQKITMPNFMK